MICERAKGVVRGAVQGVGFRPFVYRLAHELELTGSVSNSTQGVLIEVEGARARIDEFWCRLESEKPPHAIIDHCDFAWTTATGSSEFQIRESDSKGPRTAVILPDLATCADCLREISDPANRRYSYPFTNCTHCGPRFSIIEALPYDRVNTSMRRFTMCPVCEEEYHDPRNRRFHAQPNACPGCGPHLELWDSGGSLVAGPDESLLQAADSIRAGQILALKGIGGFQLLVDARDSNAVLRLRARKRRKEKPFAVMVRTLDSVRAECRVESIEEDLLQSPEAPIVLLDRLNENSQIADAVAPGNPLLGMMLPYSPLHHLLMRELEFPVVATSGNLSNEPICTDEREALERLCGIADLFLVHNRPIVRHVDDSIVRVVLGREMILRRARGYAPLPVLRTRDRQIKPIILAVGAHLKNAVALGDGNNVYLSQHIGDLETLPAITAFRKVAVDLTRLYATEPDFVACDLHPDFVSTRYARELGVPAISVQHHYAHVLSCMAENEIDPPLLGVAWDGTGLGDDGTIWGGEFLLITEQGFQRVAHLRTFRLPGGEAAIRQPRRSALGLLYEVFGEAVFERRDFAPTRNFTREELSSLRVMLRRGLNSPVSSSMGRFFDAIASILDLRQQSTFEGQAAMALEFAIQPGVSQAYPISTQSPVIDWESTILAMLSDLQFSEPVGFIAAKLHNTLAEIIAVLARRIGEPRVVLTGGCFQNEYLLERAVHRLRDKGFQPFWHRQVPTNDGGIALGQIVATRRALGQKKALA